MKMEELGATLMNIQLVESLAQIINSLTPEEQAVLNQKVNLSFQDQELPINLINYQDDWQEVTNIIIRSIMDYKYQQISQKITNKFDREWLDNLESEEDYLQAAVELTKYE
jgi:hypothetical protein